MNGPADRAGPGSARGAEPAEPADQIEPAEPVEVVVPELLGGMRADRAVSMLTGCSRRAAAQALAGGGVAVDGRPVSSGATRLAPGQRLSIAGLPVAGASSPVAEPDVAFVVVHEDDDLVVVDKPPGLVVHPGAGHRTGTLVNGLVARYPDLVELARSGVCAPERPGIVHRLDRQTSGLLVVARSDRAYRDLVAQLSGRTVERRYRALVHGVVAADEGIIEAPIGRAPGDPTLMAVVAGGKPARTRYRVERRFDGPDAATSLTLRLETGRTHQVRVHLSAIGHPVVGDDRYGAPSGSSGPPGPPGPSGPGAPAALPEGRIFLHAAELGFVHPASGAQVRWESALPPDLEAVLASWPLV